jgi:hypothetical protein
LLGALVSGSLPIPEIYDIVMINFYELDSSKLVQWGLGGVANSHIKACKAPPYFLSSKKRNTHQLPTILTT